MAKIDLRLPGEEEQMRDGLVGDLDRMMPTNVADEDGLPMELTDESLVKRAEELLQKYRNGKQHLDDRIVENEKWYRKRHGVHLQTRNPDDPTPTSGWLFNALANKHADAMDNMPTLSVLPREESDKSSAEMLSDILPVVLEQNSFEQVYSDMWWYKLRTGTGLTGVFWDSSKLNGLGDISIVRLDLINLFWEPGITDLQKSQNVFYVTLEDGEQMRQQYPELKDVEGAKLFGSSGITLAEYAHDDTIDTTDKLMMIDWYYKRMVGGKTVLHYCKICAGVVLFCSEREPGYEDGFYMHGKYPFELDALFPVPDSPAGFGYIDICKPAQLYIDKLDQALLKNTIIGARPRFWVKGDGKVRAEDYADMSLDFVAFEGSGNPNDSIVQIPVPELNPYAVTMRDAKIAELKEVSGNRDFSQGGTSGGVTAFSAIQALKEAGSKLSRDMIYSAYRSFANVGYLCIELMRQFYTEPRTFRVTGARGEMRFTQFSGGMIAPQTVGDSFTDTMTREPVFDIRVVAQKSDPYSTAMQNERAQALYQMGAFNPQMADQVLLMLEMMDFEGIDRIKAKISEQGTMYQQMQQMAQLSLAMASELDRQGGSQYAPQVQMIMQQQGMMPASDPTGGIMA